MLIPPANLHFSNPRCKSLLAECFRKYAQLAVTKQTPKLHIPRSEKRFSRRLGLKRVHLSHEIYGLTGSHDAQEDDPLHKAMQMLHTMRRAITRLE